MAKEDLLNRVTEFYLKSRDFNGLPASGENPAIVREFVDGAFLSVSFGDYHPNPHIKAFEPESVKEQIEKVEKVGLAQACLYPTESHLKKIVKKNEYSDKPFTLKLKFGEPLRIPGQGGHDSEIIPGGIPK